MNPLWAKNASLTVLGNWERKRKNYHPRFQKIAQPATNFVALFISFDDCIKRDRVETKGRTEISISRNGNEFRFLDRSCPLAWISCKTVGERSSRSTRLIYKSNRGKWRRVRSNSCPATFQRVDRKKHRFKERYWHGRNVYIQVNCIISAIYFIDPILFFNVRWKAPFRFIFYRVLKIPC